MEIKLKRLNSVERELEVRLSPQEVAPIRESICAHWQERAEIPGYRKGKAPLELVLKKHRHQIEEELKENLINFFYKKAISASNLLPITAPYLLEANLNLDGGAFFKLKVEEKPKFKLPKYKGLRARKERISVKEEEIQEALEELKKDWARWVEVERSSREGDLLILDLKISSQDGKLLEEKKGTGFILERKVLLPGLLENLLGLEKNSFKKFLLYVPANFQDKKIAGKRCQFLLKVKSVREKKEPTIDDDFARTIGRYQDLEDLKKAINRELEAYKERKAEFKLEEELLQSIISNTKIELPPQLLHLQTRRIAENIALNLLYRGVSKAEIENQNEAIWKQAEEEAIRQIKLYFVLEEIAQKENIEVSEQELEKEMERLASREKVSLQELRTALETKGELENLRSRLRREKAIELIKTNAQVEPS